MILSPSNRDQISISIQRGTNQFLLMCTLANFTFSNRREILEKSSVSENLQDSLLRSPLSDKVFVYLYRRFKYTHMKIY